MNKIVKRFTGVFNARYLLIANVFLTVLATYFIYVNFVYKKEIKSLTQNITELQNEISNKKEEIKRKDDLISSLQVLVRAVRTDKDKLEKEYYGMLGAIDQAAKSVEIFKKKAEADKMLLAKYSKVFFLNEHYAPAKLQFIPPQYTGNKNIEVKSEVYPFLIKMLSDMKKAGLNPEVVSGYRSFDKQKNLKGKYLSVYGSGANTFSADQGYSEHQLGTTFDITKSGMSLTAGMDNTEEFKWLESNAWKYGFVLSYPKNNSYYTYEPWHWRFVGLALAKRLHDENKYFYDLSQNEIYKYLINIFDGAPE